MTDAPKPKRTRKAVVKPRRKSAPEVVDYTPPSVTCPRCGCVLVGNCNTSKSERIEGARMRRHTCIRCMTIFRSVAPEVDIDTPPSV